MPRKKPDLPVIEIPVPLLSEQEWTGWKVRGRYLIAPDGQRIHQRRLLGLMWREEQELRRAGFASRDTADRGRVSPHSSRTRQMVKVVIVDLADVRVNGRTAG